MLPLLAWQTWIGIQLGTLFPIGMNGELRLLTENQALLSTGLKLESDAQYQAWGVRVSLYPTVLIPSLFQKETKSAPFLSGLELGLTVRDFFLRAPWSPAFDAGSDRHLALSPHLRYRFEVGPEKTWAVTPGLSGLFLSSDRMAKAPEFQLEVQLAYALSSHPQK